LLAGTVIQWQAGAADVAQGITVEEVANYHGHPAFRIVTPTATYVYDKVGAGFGSMIDPDGKDWISFRPTGGSDGKYRGIPNAIHPEGGFHPGSTNCTTRLVSSTPERLVLESETKDGRWACRWEIIADRATMTLMRVGHPYWLLYEGTPGGAYNEQEAFMVDSAGTRIPCARRWERRLPKPRWVYFGTKSSRYVLFLIDHTERPSDVRDSFWSMQRNMTVFGFGRVLNSRSPRWKHLKAVPARMTIGLMRNVAPEETRKRLKALAQETPAP
jgi:hypothetical protein